MLNQLLPVVIAALIGIDGNSHSNATQLLPGRGDRLPVRREGSRDGAVRLGMRRDGAGPRPTDELLPSRPPARNVERKTPAATTWLLATLIGLPAAYLLSFGPACWLAWNLPLLNGQPIPVQTISKLYHPIVLLISTGPRWISGLIMAYLRVFRDGDNGRHLMAVVLGLERLRPANF